MRAIDQEYLTVDEAATLLRVASSTIRRWIRQGDLPAYRIGHRRIALKRDDLNGLISPARPARELPHYTIYTDASQIPKLTPEDVQRGLDALERAQRINKAILERRGGKPLESSIDIIHEMREERMRQLG